MPEQHLRNIKDTSQIRDQALTASSVAGYDLVYNRDLLTVTDEKSLQTQHANMWEAYVGALRTIRKGQRLAERLSDYIEGESERKNAPRLRQRQLEVVGKIQQSLQNGIVHGCVVMPTGSGKTAIFAKVAEGLGQRTLVVTESQIGVDQIHDSFHTFAPSMTAGKVYGGGKSYDNQVTVTTYASLKTEVESGRIKPEDFGFVVFDEAHKSLTLDRIDTANYFRNCIRLAFTATPKYTEEKQVELVFGPEIDKLSIRDGVKNELLAPSISSYVVKTDIDISSVTIDAEGDYSEEELDKVINTQGRNQAAIDVYREYFLGESTIINCAGIKHAQSLEAMLNAQLATEGVVARTITGDTPPGERDAMIEAYKRGEIHILCNAQVLSYSFDAPNAAVCLNLRPTTSRVLAEQRAGRVTRRDDNDRWKHARVVDFLDKGFDVKHPPIIYAQILGEADIRLESYPDTYTPRRGQLVPTTEKDITVRGITVMVTEPEEVMQITRELDTVETVDHLAGYITFPELMSKIPDDRRQKLIRKLADEMRDVDFTARGFSNEERDAHSLYYPENSVPDIIDRLQNNYPTPSEEWTVMTAAAARLGRKWQSFEKIIAADLEEHPERVQWFSRFWNNRGESPYIHAEYMAILERELARTIEPLVPGTVEGRRKFRQTTGFTGGEETMDRILADLTRDHPEWLGTRFDGIRNRTTYTASLVEAMKIYVAERKATVPTDTGELDTTMEDLYHSISGTANKQALKAFVEQRVAGEPDATDLGIRREGRRGTVGIRMTRTRGDALLREFRSRNDELPAESRVLVSTIVAGIVDQIGGRPKTVEVRINRWIAAKEKGAEIRRKRDIGDVFNHETKKMGRAVTREIARQIKQELFGIIEDDSENQ